MKPLNECRLYAFIDTAYLRGRAPEVLAQELCDGGADLIQLRAKTEPVQEVQRLAEAILPVTRRAGVGLVINDHLSVAQALQAEYCHLGQEDFSQSGHRRISSLTAGSSLRLGLSTHSPEQAIAAVEAGADYLGVGPVFATATKPGAEPVTLEYVRWAARHIRIPWFAIGGITLQNLDTVLAMGAQRICVVSAILATEDVRAACRSFKARLGG